MSNGTIPTTGILWYKNNSNNHTIYYTNNKANNGNNHNNDNNADFHGRKVVGQIRRTAVWWHNHLL